MNQLTTCNKDNQRKWIKLLSAKRYYDKDNKSQLSSNNIQHNDSEEQFRSEFLKDLDRIVYSTYFRTLQDKTQVYPLSRSSTVRTRLTHSLEVAGVGRTLGYQIGTEIIKKYHLPSITAHDISHILQAACLAHDIGNPPFGHVGENAIVAFFEEKRNLAKIMQARDDKWFDLINFDGNPQGFRILSKLARHYGRGLNLTYATLGCFLKYPRACKPSKENLKDTYKTSTADKNPFIGTKKLGVFTSEAEILENIAEELGLIRLSNADEPIFYRHPLTFLLEAADDICYLIADIEDAHSVNLTSFEQLKKLLLPIASNPPIYCSISHKNRKDSNTDNSYKDLSEEEQVEWFRGHAINNLIRDISAIFLTNEEKILRGELNSDLLTLSIYKEDIQECRDYACNTIFTSKDKTSSEIRGIKVIQEILAELFSAIVETTHPKRKLIERLFHVQFQTKEHLHINTSAITEDTINSFHNDLVTILDCISSYPDSKLLEFHNILKG